MTPTAGAPGTHETEEIARLRERMHGLANDLHVAVGRISVEEIRNVELTRRVAVLEAQSVTQHEFRPVSRGLYGIASLILLAVVAAMVRAILKA